MRCCMGPSFSSPSKKAPSSCASSVCLVAELRFPARHLRAKQPVLRDDLLAIRILGVPHEPSAR
eukprot:scaffold2879_cov269-Prasinococcus_capsulatus_cf.AAC.40